MSRRPVDRRKGAKRRRPPTHVPRKVTPTLPPRLPPQARAKIKMAKGRYRIVSGDRVIEQKEIITMIRKIKE